MLKSGASTFARASISAEAPGFGTRNSGDLTPISGVFTDASIPGVCIPRFNDGLPMPSSVLPIVGPEMFGLL